MNQIWYPDFCLGMFCSYLVRFWSPVHIWLFIFFHFGRSRCKLLLILVHFSTLVVVPSYHVYNRLPWTTRPHYLLVQSFTFRLGYCCFWDKRIDWWLIPRAVSVRATKNAFLACLSTTGTHIHTYYASFLSLFSLKIMSSHHVNYAIACLGQPCALVCVSHSDLG
jgi:hypothetical protein